MSTRTIHFPLTLPEDAGRWSHCAGCLSQQLGARRGIEAVRVLLPDGQVRTPTLELTYDPTAISLEQLRRHVRHTGCAVDLAMAQVVLPIEGLVSPRKEATVQAVLNRLPGVTAVASFTSGTVRLEFDRRRCALPQVVSELERLGVRVRWPELPTESRTGAAPPRMVRGARRLLSTLIEYPQLGTAVLGGLCLLAAVIVHLTAGPTWLRAALLLPAYGLCGWRTAWETLRTLRRLRVDIDVLMFAAALGAAALGAYEEGALLLLLFALGGAGEQLAIGRARRAIEALTRLAPPTATRLDELGRAETVPVEQLAVGDRIRIGADEQVPADAVVTEGHSSVDQSPITGESVPVEKRPGDAVFAGTFNGPGLLTAEVTRPTTETTLAKVIRLVEQAQTTRSPTQQLAVRFERWYVPFVLVVTGLLMVVPPLAGWTPRQQGGALWAGWFYQALAFLTAASPCALAIGTPAAVLSGIARAARVGVLVKGGAHLEHLAEVRAVAFDKTGTLTRGRPRVVQVVTLGARPGDGGSLDDSTLLRFTAAVEQGSRHPLAMAIVDEAVARRLELPAATDVQREMGLGVRGTVDGRAVAVGSPTLLGPQVQGDPDARFRISAMRDAGQTVVCVGLDDQLAGLITLADQPRPTAAAAVAGLREVGITQTVMLTGDHPAPAAAIARQVGIDRVEADLRPEQKLATIRRLDEELGGVAMVGDGVNDAPALAAATVGIAIGGATGVGSDVALETADVALLADDLRRLPEAIGLARFTRHIIRQNLVIALGVIAVLAPLAAGGVAAISAAVFFHEGSTVLVVANALRVLRWRHPAHDASSPTSTAPADLVTS